MKHEVFEEYNKRPRLVLQFKLNGKDKVKAVKHKGCYSYMIWTGSIKLWMIANWKIEKLMTTYGTILYATLIIYIWLEIKVLRA